MIITLLVISAVCLVVAMHPFVTYPLSLLLIRVLQRKGARRTVRSDAPNEEAQA